MRATLARLHSVHTVLALTILVVVVSFSLLFLGQAEAVADPKPGDLFTCQGSNTVYYLASNNKRYIFRTAAVYNTWYSDFSGVSAMSRAVCRPIVVGGDVRMRPGTVLLKQRNRAEVYALAAPNVLRHIKTAAAAQELYGANWYRTGANGPLRVVDSLSAYTVGSPIMVASDYSRDIELAACPTINVCLGLGAIVPPAPPAPPEPPQPPEPPVTPPPAGPVCGNGQCETGETTASCASDCPATPPPAQPPASSGTGTGGIGDISRPIVQPPLAVQALGQWFTDPAFGTRIRRVTDKAASGGFGTQIYSQLQAFSRDNQYILLIENEGYVIRGLASLGAVTMANDTDNDNNNGTDIVLSEINDPRWQPALPATLVFYNNAPRDGVLKAQYGTIDPVTNRLTIEDVFTFPADYRAIRPNQSFDELSHDGRWMTGMASTANGDVIFSLDLTNRRLGAVIPLRSLYVGGPCLRTADANENIDPIDWVAASPSGGYIAAQFKRDGTGRCSGLETFNIQTGAFVGRVAPGHQHGDLGTDSRGDFFMTFETMDTPNGDPYISIRRLPGPAVGEAVRTLLLRLQWSQAGWHISCQAVAPFCSFVTGGSSNEAMGGEIGLLDTDGKVLRLAHHRSTQCGYWVQPRASISRDAKYLVYATDWGTNRCGSNELGRGDAMILERPATALGVQTNPPSSDGGAGSGDQSGMPPQNGGTPAPLVATTGPLPASTYTLKSTESITMQSTDSGTGFYVDPRVGTGTCFATDFIKYDIYTAPIGSTTYTLVGTHTGTAAGQFKSGMTVDSGGCAKERMIYNGVGSGSYMIGLCLTNTQSTGQRVCRTLQVGGTTQTQPPTAPPATQPPVTPPVVTSSTTVSPANRTVNQVITGVRHGTGNVALPGVPRSGGTGGLNAGWNTSTMTNSTVTFVFNNYDYALGFVYFRLYVGTGTNDSNGDPIVTELGNNTTPLVTLKTGPNSWDLGSEMKATFTGVGLLSKTYYLCAAKNEADFDIANRTTRRAAVRCTEGMRP